MPEVQVPAKSYGIGHCHSLVSEIPLSNFSSALLTLNNQPAPRMLDWLYGFLDRARKQDLSTL